MKSKILRARFLGFIIIIISISIGIGLSVLESNKVNNAINYDELTIPYEGEIPGYSDIDSNPESTGFSYLYNSMLYMKSGMPVNFMLENRVINQNSMKVSYYLGTKCLYESPVIRPGYSLQYGYLNDSLEEGSYSLNMIVELFNLDDEVFDQPVMENTIEVDLTVQMK